MFIKTLGAALLGAIILATGVWVERAQAQAQDEQFIPLLVYRTGAFAPNGIPTANGFVDYFTLLNERDGGINGVKIAFEECEFGYGTAPGVECYERLKNVGTGASLVNPFSTGVTYALIPKASVDEVPIHSMGYGRTAAADGRVFPWTFVFPTTYWSQASAFIKYVGEQEGGMENLRGKKIALIYLNIAYGKEPIPVLEVLAEKFGYELELIPIEWPGVEQGSAWLQMRRLRPDWAFLWGWGVSNQVAIKGAAGINFPMDHFIGVWWSGNESDVIPTGDAAKGYKSANFHGIGTGFPLHDEILEVIYDGNRAKALEKNFGDVLYNRGIYNAVLNTEAIRTAQAKFGNRVMTGAEVRWGFEHLNLTEERLGELGLAGFTKPIQVTCEDHEGNGPVIFQQWDGEKWAFVSDWITPMRDVVRPMIEEAAAAFAAENNITPRDCSQEG